MTDTPETSTGVVADAPLTAPRQLIPGAPIHSDAPPLQLKPLGTPAATDADTKAKQDAAYAAASLKADEDAARSKKKSAHIVELTGGKPHKGIAHSVGNDGVEIPREGPLTIALVTTINPSAGSHPGTDINCVARLPEKSELGDVVEVHCVHGLNGTSAIIHPPKGESIGTLPVSTGHNTGTSVEVPDTAGRLFRKTSASTWQVIGG